MTMKFEGLTLGRGILRVYMVLWLCWVLVLFFSSHRELLTSVGVTYWTEQSIVERQRLERVEDYKAIDCSTTTKERDERCFALEVEMHSVLIEGVVSQDDASFALKIFMYSGVFVPIVFLFAGLFVWFLTKWVINGFVGSNKK